MPAPAPQRVFSTVTPVDYQRAQVSGGDALRERQRQALDYDRNQTNAYQQALAQKQYNDQIAQQQAEAQALLQQQQAYSSNLRNTQQQSVAGGYAPTQQVNNPRQADRAAINNGGLGGQAVKLAEKYLGMPYQWGGSNPSTSFDCSGLTQYVYKQLGINLPRVSNQQAISGQRTSIANLRPGDLVAWDRVARNGRGARGADHIALYAGNGWIIEAAKKGTNVRYRKLGGGSDASAWGVRLSY